MLSLLSVVALGFFLGTRHATDPDHLVAVATIVSRQRTLRAVAPIGVLWGLGHTATIVAVGFAIIVFGVVIPPRLGLGLEFTVSLMLMFLGAWNLVAFGREAQRAAAGVECDVPANGHDHDHDHHHPHRRIHPAVRRLDAWIGGLRGYAAARPLIVGVVHGLAGSAAVALLVLGTIRDARWAVLYLAVFGAGTIVGMLLITVAMALPVVWSAHRFARAHRAIVVVSAALSLAFGAFLAYDIGVAHGLFSSAPQWTPQ